MRHLLLIIAVFISMSCVDPRGFEDQITVEVAMWRGNASGAVTLSFDDGYIETYDNVVPLLNAMGLNGSFNVITSRVGGDYGGLSLADWGNWEAAARDGHEIASHTATHIHVDEVATDVLIGELTSSKIDIDSSIGGMANSFVYPGGAYDEKSRETVERHFISARTSDDGFNQHTRPDMHLLKSKTAASFNVEQMDGWAEFAEEEGLWLIENYHLVANENPTNYGFWISTSDFEDHLSYVMSKDLWIASQGEVAKYVIERDGSIVGIQPGMSTGNRFILTLENNLDPSIFNEELTLMVGLPKNWDKVEITQSGSMLEGHISDGILTVDVRPNKGEILVTRY